VNRFVALAAAAALLIGGSLAQAQQPGPSRYAGRRLVDALKDLQTRNLNIVFSSELVKPELRIASEPKSTTPRRILDEILAPHGLEVRSGPGRTLLVVRSRRPPIRGPAPRPPAATGAIQGRVIDARTGIVLPGVSVSIQGTAWRTTTSEEGGFRLDGLPAEPQALFVSMVGYAVARPMVDVQPGGVTELTVPLADGTGSYTEDVTVTADQFRATGVATPSHQILTNADLQDLRGVIADDPFRAVQALPGVATGDDFRSEFSVRGSDFRHMGLSIDGISTRWPVHFVRGRDDTGSVAILNGDVIDRAELSAGPYPQTRPGITGAWVGFDLREGSRVKTNGHLSVSGSTSSLVLDGPIGTAGRGSWLVAARQSYLQWLMKQIGGDGATLFGFTDAQARIVFDVTERQQVHFTFIGGRARLEQNERNPGPNSIGLGRSRISLSALGWRSTFPRAVLTQRLAVLTGDFTNDGRFDQRLGSGDGLELSYMGDLIWSPNSAWSARAGAYVRRQRESQEFRQYGFAVPNAATAVRLIESSSGSVRSLSAHGGVTWRPSAALMVDAGLAVSKATRPDQTALSPWAIAAWTLARGYSLRAGVSQARQAPDLSQMDGPSASANPRYERATNVDIGVERRMSSAVRWSLTVYHRREDDVFRQDGAEARVLDGLLVPAAPIAIWQNALKGSSRGIELLVQRRAAAGLTGWIGYNYGGARYTDTRTGESFWADFDQRHALNVYGHYRLSPKTSLSGKIRIGSNFPLPGYLEERDDQLFVTERRNTLRLPRYARVDVRANHTFSYTKRRLTLFAEVVNLLGHTNYGPTDGFVRPSGEASGFVEKLFPFLPSAGFLFEF